MAGTGSRYATRLAALSRAREQGREYQREISFSK